MADLVLSVIIDVILIVFGAIPVVESENFPLDDCSSDEMDLLCLYFDHRKPSKRRDQQSMCDQTVQDIVSFPSNKTTTRVMSADVIDRFSVHNPSINVSSWHFPKSLGSDIYGANEQQVRKQQYTNIKEACELKIQFVQRLFSEMGGVRENVTHIAVIYLDGSALTFKESRSVPRIVEQQATDIKVFVVVFDVPDTTDMVYLSDTLLLDQAVYMYSKHVLTMAICNRCIDGWFFREHNNTAYSGSCYKFLDSTIPLNAVDAKNKCLELGSHLVAIETKEELHFLQARIHFYFTELLNLSQDSQSNSQFSVQVYIGLYRDVNGVSKRFHWKLLNLTAGLPLVVNDWLPGKPAGGRGSDCAVWHFVWNRYKNDTNLLMVENNLIEGWLDVGCETKLLAVSLCEMDIPRRLENNTMLRITPATAERFSQTLTKGDFNNFNTNLVSVSANIARSEFENRLKETDTEFPRFDCGVGEDQDRYISYVYVCDNIHHCSDRRDETFCMSELEDDKEEGEMYTRECKGVYCCDGSCLPLQWVNDGEIDCNVCEYTTDSQVNDESVTLINYLQRNETCAIICNSYECIRSSQLNDGNYDCVGNEGPLDETLGKLETANSCYDVFGHQIWAPKCVYVRDKMGAVLGCRDMSHLKDCTVYQCPNGYFKCPDTYCIPQQYILDGQVDCPTGVEEEPDIIGPCTGNFACWNSRTCLNLDQVCDGHPDCPHRDDEVDCHVLCTKGFRCVSGTVTVSDYNRSIPLGDVYPIDSRIRYLDLSGVDLSIADFTPLGWSENVIVIVWSNCQIGNSISSYFSYLWRVRELDLSYNLIQVLDGTYMSYSPLQNVRRLNLSYNAALIVVKYLEMTFLETLDLSHTGLSDVDASFLVGLHNLKHLNLSSTFISNLHKIDFFSKLILQTLDLCEVRVDSFYENMFSGLTISQHLYTDSYELCCPQIRGVNIPYYTCHGPNDVISSCFDLVRVNVQRILLWVVAVLAVLGNMAVIGYRAIWDRSLLTTGYRLLVTNLGISDFIMGVYLFIIAGADYYYRGVYVLYDKTWREGMTCRFAGFLATLSSETSIFCILLITVDRFLVVKFPFGQVRFSRKIKISCLLLSWIIGFILALIPVVLGFETYSSTAMCIGLPLTAKRLYGWEYSFSVYIVLNLCQCLLIAYGQRAIFQAMSENRINGTSSNPSLRRQEDITVAKQLSFVALSNFLCWFPIGVIGLLMLGGHTISNDVYAWIAVIVLPINSAANPFLYTIPALVTKWEQFKSGESKTRSISNSLSRVTNQRSMKGHK